ncbi:TetR/AcrR family transcriptional regulator [Streptomyces sp. H27-D2]|uniref:TetR/AcrR family transcriptional regulator n=1 Tax=Streptomyces sp. H27-D2 TaxID=3046304 RepID=UPI002DB8FFC5|nr:TetR/AcrR family transcriptional regulator [Streptomyces sp. H27-D2]MEC4020834.1 TetR/AcrR family transcriptional regulator [Streptomyces sp. H27-D2]
MGNVASQVWNGSHMTLAGAKASERTTQPLTRSQIVAAGMRLLKREGAAGLSMRKLANELGKAPAAVYRHLSDKRELMSLLFDEVSRQFVIPDAGDDPREEIIEAVENAHRVMEEHKWIVTVILDGTLLTPNSLRLSQFILNTMIRGGMSDAQAARLHVAIWQYVLGHLLVAQSKGWYLLPRSYNGFTRIGDKLDEYPAVRRIAPVVNEMSDHERFAAGLKALLDGAFAETAD